MRQAAVLLSVVVSVFLNAPAGAGSSAESPLVISMQVTVADSASGRTPYVSTVRLRVESGKVCVVNEASNCDEAVSLVPVEAARSGGDPFDLTYDRQGNVVGGVDSKGYTYYVTSTEWADSTPAAAMYSVLDEILGTGSPYRDGFAVILQECSQKSRAPVQVQIEGPGGQVTYRLVYSGV